jgi:hypothetical protein
VVDERTLDLRRAAVTLAVVAVHVALIIVMLRSAGRSTDVVDVTLFALPIHPEDRPREPVHVQKPPISRASETAPRRAVVARESATERHVDPSLGESSRSENDTLGDTVAAHAGALSEPASPIDWHAEIETSARALEQRGRVESGRRSLAGPKQPALSASPKAPACPFERCEPGWGAHLGIFKSQRSKAGRIEQIPDDMPTNLHGSSKTKGSQVVRWLNNWCYVILVTEDRARRNMPMCFFPLGESAARGDLFDPMYESPPPRSHDNDLP